MGETHRTGPEEIEVALVVDDDGIVVHLLARTLAGIARRVMTAKSLAEASARLMSCERIDVVVGDFTLQTRGDGLEVLDEARERHPNSARILTSGYAPGVVIERALADGLAHEFMPKPFGPDRVESIIRSCSSRRVPR